MPTDAFQIRTPTKLTPSDWRTLLGWSVADYAHGEAQAIATNGTYAEVIACRLVVRGRVGLADELLTWMSLAHNLATRAVDAGLDGDLDEASELLARLRGVDRLIEQTAQRIDFVRDW